MKGLFGKGKVRQQVFPKQYLQCFFSHPSNNCKMILQIDFEDVKIHYIRSMHTVGK